MDAAFKLEPAERAPACDGDHGLLYAPQLGIADAGNAGLPALALGVAHVHAQQQRGKQRCFVAARAGTDFHDHAAVIVGVMGNQEQAQLVPFFLLPWQQLL